LKETEYSLGMQENGRDWAPKKAAPHVTELPIVESGSLSKDEYIAKLEAELRGFRGETSKASPSTVALPTQSARRKRDENGEGSVSPGTIVKFN